MNAEPTKITPSERRACNDNALRCFGTAYIFEQRAWPLRIATKILAFSSIAGPLSVGLLARFAGSTSAYLPTAIMITSIVAILQCLIALWSLSVGWPQNLAYYIESKSDNYMNADKLRDLANDVHSSPEEWRAKRTAIETHVEYRTKTDLRLDLSDEEKTMGMRAALREYNRACANENCNTVPTSMVPSECPVCGNFKKRWLRWLM